MELELIEPSLFLPLATPAAARCPGGRRGNPPVGSWGGDRVSDPRVLVLVALRLASILPTEAVVERSGLSAAQAQDELSELEADGLGPPPRRPGVGLDAHPRGSGRVPPPGA